MAQKDIETCFNYCDRKVAFFSSDEPKWIRKIRKLAEKHPDEVTILKQPEDNDGCIYVRLPPKALRVQLLPPMSEARKEAARKNFALKE